MEEFEITCLYLDERNCISHCGVSGYGVQLIALIESLLTNKICRFFVINGEEKINVHSINSSNGSIFLTDKSKGSKLIELDFLPQYDKSQLNQLIRSVH
ncbi:MAG TPA: hypothetical protein VLE21_00700 [Candidatus Nitrosocosmicus sp.]|nr:hypothetical protein [Candidatus Nitrosocosmicus sp.]